MFFRPPANRIDIGELNLFFTLSIYQFRRYKALNRDNIQERSLFLSKKNKGFELKQNEYQFLIEHLDYYYMPSSCSDTSSYVTNLNWTEMYQQYKISVQKRNQLHQTNLPIRCRNWYQKFIENYISLRKLNQKKFEFMRFPYCNDINYYTEDQIQAHKEIKSYVEPYFFNISRNIGRDELLVGFDYIKTTINIKKGKTMNITMLCCVIKTHFDSIEQWKDFIEPNYNENLREYIQKGGSHKIYNREKVVPGGLTRSSLNLNSEEKLNKHYVFVVSKDGPQRKDEMTASSLHFLYSQVLNTNVSHIYQVCDNS
jgi:hypothetical protein